jgi:hypothetical protein
MTVIQMSQRELSRLRVMIDFTDGRLTVSAAAELMGVGRRQVFRLRRAFEAAGPTGFLSKKRGRPSNRRHGASFRRTVMELVREHFADFGPTLAAEKLSERHGLRLGVETLRQWMIVAASASVSWCRSMARSMHGSKTVALPARCWPSSMTPPAASCSCALLHRNRRSSTSVRRAAISILTASRSRSTATNTAFPGSTRRMPMAAIGSHSLVGRSGNSTSTSFAPTSRKQKDAWSVPSARCRTGW